MGIAIPGQKVLGCLTKQSECALGSKPVNSDDPDPYSSPNGGWTVTYKLKQTFLHLVAFG